MPRGWRDVHKPETADSQRGRRKMPRPWMKRDCDKDSNFPPVSSHESATEHTRFNETMKSRDFPMVFAPPILNEGLEVKSSDKTEALDTGNYNTQLYSLTDSLKPEVKLSNIQSVDGASNYSSPTPDDGSSSIAYSSMANSSGSKPLSTLLPFLAMPSTVSVMGSITSPTSVPQWMQLLGKQDGEAMPQDLSSGL